MITKAFLDIIGIRNYTFKKKYIYWNSCKGKAANFSLRSKLRE